MLGQLPQAYQDAVNKLLADLKISTEIKTQRKLFNNFYQRYTMIPELWNELIK